jgi:UDP-3-O-[3-hydroxymyristoyl] glucosamine N-acyltransferase
LLLRDLANQLDCRLEGDGDVEIARVASLEEAGAGDVTFLANAKYQRRLERTRASAVILGNHDTITHPIPPDCARLWAENPYLAFAQAIRLFHPAEPPRAGVDERTVIAPDVTLGEGVSIGPFVVIAPGASIGARTIIEPHVLIGAGASIGDDCTIRSHVAIRDRVIVGHRVIIQNGAVLGSEGFGFVPLKNEHYKIPQLATLVLEDDVEIGANTTIDRPAVGETRIGAGTKIDNLVQIAHGVSIGRRVLLAAQVGIAGSTVIEDDVVLAGQVGVAGHLTIGKGAVLGAQSGLTGSVAPGEFLTGYPAIENRTWRKSSIVFKQLPDMKKRIGELEQKIAELEEKLAACETRSDPA